MHGQGDAGTVSDEDVLATGEGYVIAGCTSRGVNFNSFSASVFSGASQWYQRAQKAFGMHSTKLALSAAAASPASSSDKEDVTAACCYEQYALEQERLQQSPHEDRGCEEAAHRHRRVLRPLRWPVESSVGTRFGRPAAAAAANRLRPRASTPKGTLRSRGRGGGSASRRRPSRCPARRCRRA